MVRDATTSLQDGTARRYPEAKRVTVVWVMS
jgi:hypothetical protein